MTDLPEAKFQKLMTYVIAAAVLWTLINVLTDFKWYDMNSKEMASVQGCYSVDGHPAFRIVGKTLIAGNQSWGFEGRHEKSADMLWMNHHLRFSWAEGGRLVEASTTTGVPIDYGPPLTLDLIDDRDQSVKAVRADCY